MFRLLENKISIIILSTLMLLLYSCNKLEISNLKCYKLTTSEINKLPATQEIIKRKSEEQYEIQYDNANNIHRQNSHIPRKIKLNVLENLKYDLSRDTFYKNNPNLMDHYVMYYTNKIIKEKKYGIHYSFNFVNEYNEPVESTKFIVQIIYKFNNKDVVFEDIFTENKLLKEGKFSTVSRDIVFNFQKGYDKAYFETYTAKSKLINIKAISENNIGFRDTITFETEIE